MLAERKTCYNINGVGAGHTTPHLTSYAKGSRTMANNSIPNPPNTTTTEEWRDIPGYEGLYQVSSLGNFRGLARMDSNGARRQSALMLPHNHKSGYYYITLSKASRQQTFSAHRLVAACFLGERPDGTVINHRDGDKHNNCVDNLEYCTPGENQLHAYRMGLRDSNIGENNSHAKLTESDVKRIKILLREGNSRRKIALMFGVSHQNINGIANGKYWAHLQDKEE